MQPVGDPVGLVDEAVWFNAREPIAQTFIKDGDAFTVVANHFKSKSPGAADRRQRRHRRRSGRSGTATGCGRPPRWPTFADELQAADRGPTTSC